jgi:hypothetical protein
MDPQLQGGEARGSVLLAHQGNMSAIQDKWLIVMNMSSADGSTYKQILYTSFQMPSPSCIQASWIDFLKATVSRSSSSS